MSTSANGLSAKTLLGIGVGVGVTVLSGASYWYLKYWKQDVMPERWERVGTLQQINLYPIKSCAPLKLAPEMTVACELLGLSRGNCRDRTLMLIDDQNQFVTARAYPRMVLIESKMLGPSQLEITAPHMEPLELDYEKLAEEAPGCDVHTAIFGAKVDAMLCGAKYDKWFSEFILGKESGLRLVYYPYSKPTKPIAWYMVKEPYITKLDTGTFNDATSYMLMNLSSVDDLNKRLQRSVSAMQFRGSFHLKMDNPEPYAEDRYEWVKIGEDAVFRKVAPCLRCILPNINPFTGERDPDCEPLKTLKTYRNFGKNTSPTLGIHMGLRQAAAVKVNDVIYVGVK